MIRSFLQSRALPLAYASSLFLALSASRLALKLTALHQRNARALRNQWRGRQTSSATDTPSVGNRSWHEPDSPVWDCFCDPYVQAKAIEHLKRCHDHVSENPRHRPQ